MNGTVTKLCDFDSVRIPEELLTVCADEQQVEQEVEQLSVRYAVQTSVQTVEEGDVVYCTADAQSYPDARDIILYTAIDMPGAEKASQAVNGKSVGDTAETEICGKDVKLWIKKIIRLSPAEVNDELVASIGIDGVLSVEAYRAYVTEKLLADAASQNHKMAVREVILGLVAGSEFDYDEAELDEYVKSNLEQIEAEYNAYGIEMPAIDEIRESILDQFKENWLAREYCSRKGITVDRAAAEADADQMIEMLTLMGENVPSREQMIEEAINNTYSTELFVAIDEFVTEKMGR